MQNKAEQFEFNMTMAELELLAECVEYTRQGLKAEGKMDCHFLDIYKMGKDLKTARQTIMQSIQEETAKKVSNVIEVDFEHGCVVNG